MSVLEVKVQYTITCSILSILQQNLDYLDPNYQDLYIKIIEVFDICGGGGGRGRIDLQGQWLRTC